MKHFSIVLYLFLSVVYAGATVHSVSNAAGDVTDFSSLSDAILAANNGDSIYLQPSLNGYGNIALDKQLFILGAGHNPAFSDYASTIGVITFNSGSSGSVVKGCVISGLTGSTWNTANNIYIANNRITAQNPTYFPSGTWTNWIFEGNVIASQSNGINCGYFGEGLVFRNNVLHTFAGSIVMSNVGIGSLFENNLFLITNNNVAAKVFSSSNGVISRNNIIYVTPTTVEDMSSGCSSCTWENNATYSPNATFPDLPGISNLNNTNPNFVNVPLLSPDYNYAYDYHLNALSPLLTGAADGGEIGLFGGVFLFSMTGEDQTLPRMISVTPLVTTAPPGGVLSITIQAAAAGN
jgi:hypothetical protein